MLIVAAVLFFLPGLFTRWFLPKELLTLGAVLLASRVAPTGRLPRAFWIVVLSAAAIMLVAALASEAPLNQLMGRWPRFEGLVSLPVYCVSAWFGARLLGPTAPVEHFRWFTRTVALAALVLAAVSGLEELGFAPISSDLARSGALLGNATDQGIVAAMFATMLSLPLYRALDSMTAASASRFRSTGSEVLLISSGFAATVLTVMFSGSRAGLLALILGVACVGAVLFVCAWRSEGMRSARMPLMFGGGLTLVLLGSLLAIPGMRLRVFGLSGFAQRTIDDRFLIWNETGSVLAKFPILGVGPSGYLDVIATRHTAQWYLQADTGTVLDSPHNWILQAGMAGGVPLIIVAFAFIAILVVSYVRALRSRSETLEPQSGEARQVRKGTASSRTRAATAFAQRRDQALSRSDLLVVAGASLLALSLALLTHFTAAATGILGGVLVGIVIAVAPRTELRRWRRIRTGLVAVWIVLLAVAMSADFSLQRGLVASNSVDADREFRTAQALRPWDGDLSSIAAQSMTARADQGDPAAAEAALRWATASLLLLPGNVPTRTAEGVALRLSGQLELSVDKLGLLAAELPYDPDIAVQHGISLALAGSSDDARAELERAAELRPEDPVILDLLKQFP